MADFGLPADCLRAHYLRSRRWSAGDAGTVLLGGGLALSWVVVGVMELRKRAGRRRLMALLVPEVGRLDLHLCVVSK